MSNNTKPKIVNDRAQEKSHRIGYDGDMSAATALIQKLISQQDYTNGAPFEPIALAVSTSTDWTPIFGYEAFARTVPIYYQYNGSPSPGYIRALGDWVETTDSLYVPFPACSSPPLLVTYDTDYSALATPVNAEIITGNNGDGSDKTLVYWQLIPPSGYVALGMCYTTSFNTPPDLEKYWCVREDLCISLAQTLLWSDAGFGWDNNGDLFLPQIDQDAINAVGGGSCIIAPGTPVNGSNSYGLVLSPCVIQANLEPVYPSDVPAGSLPPTSFAAGVNNIVVVPWNVIRDDPALDGKTASPFYYVAALPFYSADPSGGFPNPGGQSNKMVATTVGLSSTDSVTFTETTSLELSATGGAEFDGTTCGLSASVTDTLSLETQTSNTYETQIAVNVTIYPPTATMVYLWDLNVAIIPFRQDGTSMKGAIFGRSVVVTSVQSN